LHFVHEFFAGHGDGKRLAFLFVDRHGLVDDIAEFGENGPWIVAVAAAVEQFGAASYRTAFTW